MVSKRGPVISADVLLKMNSNIKSAFSTVKEELEEHLMSINENTTELQQTSDNLCEIEQRMDKLDERLSDIQQMLGQLLNKSDVEIELSKEEQKLFLIFYTQDNFLTAKQVSEKFSFTCKDVNNIILSMSDKGVPITKEMINDEDYFKLDADFKSLQAKNQLIKIDPSIKLQFQNTLLKQFFTD